MINGATGTSTLCLPTVNASYWVRVSRPMRLAGFENVVVVVNGTVCNPASITTQPASSTISSGTPVTLTVVASGTAPLTYQWYTGDKGDTSNPIPGATSRLIDPQPDGHDQVLGARDRLQQLDGR